MILAGTDIEFVVSGRVQTWSPIESAPSTVEAAVTNSLMPFMRVKVVSVAPTTWALGGVLEYDYTARVVVATKEAHNAALDLAGYVEDAFYRATGTTPRVVLSSDPYAAEQPKPFDPFAWLKDIGAGLQSSITLVAVAAVVLGVVILREK